mmetsp:Transcript_21213/g.65466  ORF Transcript_21213/g.65466 Transcript_21213/m.65466 type:complete len:342 (+) Transcript_21213:599-1624(+)
MEGFRVFVADGLADGLQTRERRLAVARAPKELGEAQPAGADRLLGAQAAQRERKVIGEVQDAVADVVDERAADARERERLCCFSLRREADGDACVHVAQRKSELQGPHVRRRQRHLQLRQVTNAAALEAGHDGNFRTGESAGSNGGNRCLRVANHATTTPSASAEEYGSLLRILNTHCNGKRTARTVRKRFFFGQAEVIRNRREAFSRMPSQPRLESFAFERSPRRGEEHDRFRHEVERYRALELVWHGLRRRWRRRPVREREGAHSIEDLLVREGAFVHELLALLLELAQLAPGVGVVGNECFRAATRSSRERARATPRSSSPRSSCSLRITSSVKPDRL